MKKVFVLALSVLAVFGLAACDKSEESNEVMEVLNSISLSASVTEDFSLTVAKDNVVITWESNNEAIKVNGVNAVVTRQSADTTVKLTATGEKDDLTASKTFDVKVVALESLPVTSIAEALVSSDDTEVILDHVTVLKSYSSGTHFTDGENVIYAYGTKDLTIGDSYSLEAIKASYAGAPQIKSAVITKLENVDSLTLEPTVATVEEINAISSGLDYKFYSVTGVYNASSNTLTSNDSMIGINSYSLASATNLLKAYDGLRITLELFITGGYKNYKEVLIYTTQEDLDSLVFDNEDILEAALNNISLPSTTMNNLELDTVGSFDTTISWASDNEAVISTLGVVTRQSVDTTVTLTATASINGVSENKSFEVVVISSEQTVSTDLFISEYFRGNSNDKYIEIYNPSANSVDLSEYSLVNAANANTFETGTKQALTGTLDAGKSFVIYYNQTSAALQTYIQENSFGYISSTILTFNGDDGIGLFKKEELIDMFGYEAQLSIVIGDINNGYMCATRKVGYGASIDFNTDEWNAVLARENIDGTNTSVNFEGAGSHTFELETSVVNLLIALVNKDLQLSL